MRSDPAGKPLKPLFAKAFEYSDCWVNDARLVVLNARDAADRGATIRTRAKVVERAPRRTTHWAIGVEDTRERRGRGGAGRGCSSMPPARGSTTCCRARSARTTSTMSGWSRAATSWSTKKFDDPRAYFFQNRDGRIIFAIPYEDDFTLIGTTDQDYQGDPARRADQRCRDRLSLRRGQRVFRRAGAARGHRLDLFRRAAALRRRRLEGAGGDARLCAEGRRRRAARRSSTCSAARSRPIAGSPNPCWRRSRVCSAPRASHGRRVPRCPAAISRRPAFEREVARLKGAYAFLDMRLARRLVRLYGTKARALLGLARSQADLGRLLRRRSLRGARSAISSSTNGRSRPRTCCGGAPSAACGSAAKRRPSSRHS